MRFLERNAEDLRLKAGVQVVGEAAGDSAALSLAEQKSKEHKSGLEGARKTTAARDPLLEGNRRG